jgi:primosomal protein N' (replication factor Y)
LPDYRSGERTWQIIFNLKKLLNQETGRLFIQTYNPQNEAIKYAAQNDWPSFWQEELETREALNYPPYAQIVKLTLRHRDAKKVSQEAKILSAKLQHTNKDEKINISPALPAFIPKERGKFIWNIILKFAINNPQLTINNEFLQQRNLLLRYVPQNWEIDIDPENLL